MTRPLGSAPTALSRDLTATTGRSASAPGTGTHSLAGSSRLRYSLRPPRAGASRNAFSRFPARAADRAHVTYTPGTAWPVNGHPPGSSRAGNLSPVSMPSEQFRRFTSDPRDHGDCAPSSRSPPDASRAPFPHRSPRRSSANAACGGLKPPPAGRLRRARHLHLPHSTTDDSPSYIGSSSASVTHDLVGLGVHVHLSQHHAMGMVEGGEQVTGVLIAVAGAA
jgi:hypothetical protein